jgi:hypothetical protein
MGAIHQGNTENNRGTTSVDTADATEAMVEAIKPKFE